MPEEPQELLAEAGWDIPLTEEFVVGVRRGVRRRRALRRAAAGGALAAAVGVVLLVINVVFAGGTDTVVVAPPAEDRLDGFVIGYVPEGARAVPPDSSSTCAVSARPYDCPTAGAGDPTATMTARRFDRGVGMWLWITVLRPQATTPTVDRAQITEWLVGWESYRRTPVRAFDVPAGRVQLFADVGSEGTVHTAVITTDDGVVITISGAMDVPVDELTAIAENIS
ncbi:hypothetical protein [Cryptosporangium aurantiacum]|uniref:DUF4245 domain-containing protein n=1 Tax=Cryptosporangium aurantiacum TaxID=134849 RepID=A0A1M7QTC2_9ACTN|nr:hypothetical protein [Cryptosporangium aurantiacum]SHN35087.1 hypothetical protein SAMN05443668_105349 [Cryptosporangium aurantiacum]